MLLETAMEELPLLAFSLLLPISVVAFGLMGLVRGISGSEDESLTCTLDKLMAIPVITTVLGLVSAMLHVGYPLHIFFMILQVGTSPLSNEILVCGGGAGVAILYWIFAMMRHPGAKTHLICGIIVTLVGLTCGVFTGLACMISTVPTWNTPFAPVGQCFGTLLGGCVYAALMLAVAKHEESKAASLMLAVLAIVGALGVIAVVFAQGSMIVSVMNSGGMTLAAHMGDYRAFAGAGALCIVAGLVAWQAGVRKGGLRLALTSIGALAVLVGLVCIRIDFYGIYLSAGLF